jgi:cytochrome c oxidase subunit II
VRSHRAIYILLATTLWFITTGQSFQSPLDTQGQQGDIIRDLWWLFLVVLSVIFIIVMIILGRSLWKAERSDPDRTVFPRPVPETVEAEETEEEAKAKRNVAIGMALTAIIIIGLTITSYSSERDLHSHSTKNALVIEVRGHQWWWDIHYVDTVASMRAKTANEIHIPVGRPILIHGTSSDVIHSFWIPNLHGKKDFIPGQTTDMILSADRPGKYRGQCAEFCGHQHAHMAFWIVAEPQDQFDAWIRNEVQPAVRPEDTLQKRGYEVFMAAQCIMCHSIGGTPAGSNAGPDLTHFASRSTIGAGTIPNTDANLAAWITDPQRSKPGSKMPPNILTSADIKALITYLRSLK